ncbi:unnamed protein product [Blepharisma stoltei]|uniref:Protein kinase domain-containing protein n=1 Tax=Blepharisma stoltei TaxID=1481888 RepID=A0AAU9KCP6_9CILI|nr:unnamed protein product [Blepharisma stoltei]
MKLSPDSKSKSSSKPIISSRLPKAFSQPQKLKKKEEPLLPSDDFQSVLSPLKHEPGQFIKLSKALKQIEKIPDKPASQDLLGQFSNQNASHLPHIQLEDMITLSKLNSSSLKGTARKVLHAPTLKLYTITQIPINSREEGAELKDWVGKWQRAQQRHRRLVKIMATFWNSPEGCLSVVEEFIEGGSLKDLLENVICIPEKQLARIAKKVLECLVYFHKKNRYLGTISASQILFTKTGSIRLGPCLSQRLETTTFSESSDVFSLGIIVLSALCSDFEVLEPKTCCIFHSIPHNPLLSRFSPQVKLFLCQTLQIDERSRPSSQELLAQEWLELVEYPGPLVQIQDLININSPMGNREYWEAADAQLDRLCEALKVVIVGQGYGKPAEVAIEQLADELEIPVQTVAEKIHKVYEEI